MKSVLKKLPYRKVMREKGRSVCMIAAVFLTTVLFVTVFSALFFVADAAKEMMRSSSPVLADAMLVVSEEEHERICHNKRVAEAAMGIRFAILRESSGVGGIQMFTFEDKMAEWMRYYPTKGRMPAGDKEIVVSDQYLKECGLVFEEGTDGDMTVSEAEGAGAGESGGGIQMELAYYIGEQAYTDTFTVVGTYEMSGQPLHVVMTSDAFYQEVCGRLMEQGDNPQEYAYRVTGVMFKNRGNIRRLVSLMAAEEGIALEEGEAFLNDTSLFDMMGIGAWAALILLLFFVMMVGGLFISNIFQISALKEVRFYGKLSTNGVTKREIQSIIRRENDLLFMIAAIPALAAGYVVSVSVLPGI